MKLFLFFALLICSNIIIGQYTVESVPNQKLVDNSYLSDPDNYIELASDEQEINRICQNVEATNGAQIAVVVLGSIGDENPHDFGTELFNYWQLGRAGYDDGLLIILVMDQRRVEFITGYGMEQYLSDAMCYKIQQEEMVPRFKEGDYSKGLIQGLTVSADIIQGGEPPAYIYDSYDDSDYSQYTGDSVWLIVFRAYLYLFIVPTVGLFVLLFLITLFVKDRYKKYRIMKLFQLKIFMFVVPIPFVGLYFLLRKQIENWRNTVRFSKKSGLAMMKLSEEDDDKYLKAGQVSEEKVKSIDYDVWVGEGDHDVLILSYVKWFSGHSKCPKCKFKTYYLVYNRTITAATYSYSGTGEKKHKCDNCGHSIVRRYTIPKLQRSSSSGGGSSSSGGSWGGGSSGGGGSGSSW